MTISSFTGSFTDCVTKINEKSTENSWGVVAGYSGSPDSKFSIVLLDNDDNRNILFKLSAHHSSDMEEHGITFYYNNGNSNIGYENNYGSGDNTATLYFTSHGFLCINNAYRADEGTVAAWLNINDDGTIIYGGTGITSAISNLYSHLIGCKYEESSYQSLAFTPHTNPSGTTLCNASAVGTLGEPQIAKYMYYAPVYQSDITGEIEIDGERYVVYGGMWYLKD